MTADEMLRKAIAVALDEDHVANGFTLGRVEHGEHRRMGDLAVAALALQDSGLAYCTAHNGVIDCDEQRCDFLDISDPDQQCKTCGGDGVDPEDDDEECSACEGQGTTPCVPAILFYRAEP